MYSYIYTKTVPKTFKIAEVFKVNTFLFFFSSHTNCQLASFNDREREILSEHEKSTPDNPNPHQRESAAELPIARMLTSEKRKNSEPTAITITVRPNAGLDAMLICMVKVYHRKQRTTTKTTAAAENTKNKKQHTLTQLLIFYVVGDWNYYTVAFGYFNLQSMVKDIESWYHEHNETEN
ncbi:hypothetical protein GQX74_013208 [Glossina fuscipes]|nr:hypothetical protein GQX74_013208 [Glossina fuscipes]